ncbi:uncharacterized protein V1518DRAFT_408334 [Limtongia smithiae]|uniref:uncharacterized protein n=1 Tax=Limtongia smithiae TaxID=1125753 RepID=UPI0034CE190A
MAETPVSFGIETDVAPEVISEDLLKHEEHVSEAAQAAELSLNIRNDASRKRNSSINNDSSREPMSAASRGDAPPEPQQQQPPPAKRVRRDQQKSALEERGRGRRMFGALLTSLEKFKQDTKSQPKANQRAEIERKVDAAKLQNEKLMRALQEQRRIEREYQDGKSDVKGRIAKLTFAADSLQTSSYPSISYKPRILLDFQAKQIDEQHHDLQGTIEREWEKFYRRFPGRTQDRQDESSRSVQSERARSSDVEMDSSTGKRVTDHPALDELNSTADETHSGIIKPEVAEQVETLTSKNANSKLILAAPLTEQENESDSMVVDLQTKIKIESDTAEPAVGQRKDSEGISKVESMKAEPIARSHDLMSGSNEEQKDFAKPEPSEDSENAESNEEHIEEIPKDDPPKPGPYHQSPEIEDSQSGPAQEPLES